MNISLIYSIVFLITELLMHLANFTFLRFNFTKQLYEDSSVIIQLSWV